MECAWEYPAAGIFPGNKFPAEGLSRAEIQIDGGNLNRECLSGSRNWRSEQNRYFLVLNNVGPHHLMWAWNPIMWVEASG